MFENVIDNDAIENLDKETLETLLNILKKIN